MNNEIFLCILFIPILFSEICDVRIAFGDPKGSSTLGGLTSIFLVFLSFFPYGQKQVAEAFGKCIRINNMNYSFLIPLNPFHT